MTKVLKKSELNNIVQESVNDVFNGILNEGYTSIDAKEDLNIIGGYVCGLGMSKENPNVPTRKEAAQAYMRFISKFWKKLSVFD